MSCQTDHFSVKISWTPANNHAFPVSVDNFEVNGHEKCKLDKDNAFDQNQMENFVLKNFSETMTIFFFLLCQLGQLADHAQVYCNHDKLNLQKVEQELPNQTAPVPLK